MTEPTPWTPRSPRTHGRISPTRPRPEGSLPAPCQVIDRHAHLPAMHCVYRALAGAGIAQAFTLAERGLHTPVVDFNRLAYRITHRDGTVERALYDPDHERWNSNGQRGDDPQRPARITIEFPSECPTRSVETDLLILCEPYAEPDEARILLAQDTHTRSGLAPSAADVADLVSESFALHIECCEAASTHRQHYIARRAIEAAISAFGTDHGPTVAWAAQRLADRHLRTVLPRSTRLRVHTQTGTERFG